MKTIGVIGAGAWGTALAKVAAEAGLEVTLWAREPEVVEAVNGRHVNETFLPGIALGSRVRATLSLEEAAQCEALLLVSPAQHMRGVTAEIARYLKAGRAVAICAKGVEQGSLKLMSEVVAETLPEAPLAVLSGPSFADETAKGLPTAVTLACRDEGLGVALIGALGRRVFRPYLSEDVIGAQIGGAVKNVLAIACGVVEGKRFGENTRAALMTRGMAEILRLGEAMGGQRDTLMGLSGLGDLILTCSSAKSRNTSLGIALGEGRALKDILAGRRSVAEGVFSAGAVASLALRHGVDMPICRAVDELVNRGRAIDSIVEDILSRPFKREISGFPAIETGA